MLTYLSPCQALIALQADEDKIPDVPTIEERGVLPRLIQTLVERRRAVKGLMKDKSATAARLLQVRVIYRVKIHAYICF